MDEVEKVTYSELYKMVEQYASSLKKAGVKPDDRVVGECC